MVLAAGGLRADGHSVVGTGWLGHLLLEAEGQLLQLLISLVELVLNLLKFGLKTRVLVFCDVISDFEVSIVVLEVFFLHLHEVVERLALGVLFGAKYHFTQLFPFHLI